MEVAGGVWWWERGETASHNHCSPVHEEGTSWRRGRVLLYCTVLGTVAQTILES